MENRQREINDPVHGTLILHPLCMAIVDTPQFQRLRHIKQLGMTDYVYPSAGHTRFQHCLGVSFLAGKLGRQLNSSPRDVLCLEIAGLCHDLGHGPFSHTWERFMKLSLKSSSRYSHPDFHSEWKHEHVTVQMFQYLIKKNDLMPLFHHYDLDAEAIELIKNLILGKKEADDPSRAFLYQIVSNPDSGCDVDKWDYYLRDCHFLGLPPNFDYKRCLSLARVNANSNGQTFICFRDKEKDNLYQMFQLRFNLHKKAYQHRIVKIIDMMFCEALVKADRELIGPDQKMMNLFEWSMGAQDGDEYCLQKFSMLNDMVVWNAALYTPTPGMSIMHSLASRRKANFYQQLGVKQLLHAQNEESLEEDFAKFLRNKQVMIPRDLYSLQIVIYHWGMQEKDPVSSIFFYSKQNPQNAFHLPGENKAFQEIQLWLIARPLPNDEIQKLLLSCWEEFSPSYPGVNGERGI